MTCPCHWLVPAQLSFQTHTVVSHCWTTRMSRRHMHISIMYHCSNSSTLHVLTLACLSVSSVHNGLKLLPFSICGITSFILSVLTPCCCYVHISIIVLLWKWLKDATEAQHRYIWGRLSRIWFSIPPFSSHHAPQFSTLSEFSQETVKATCIDFLLTGKSCSLFPVRYSWLHTNMSLRILSVTIHTPLRC